MRKSDLHANPPQLPAALPVLCAQCRAAGQMGEGAFSYLGELLAFTPVPRRPHVNGWDPERQRGFIAALAVTGSPARAARAIGKHAFGAEQLRTARGGQSFAAAWDAAMEIARERESHHFATGLEALAAEEKARYEAQPFAKSPDPHVEDEESRSVREAYFRIRMRFVYARRLYLGSIADDPAKRAAWEVLVGKVDWDLARDLLPQPAEPTTDEIQAQFGIEDGMPRIHDPDMQLAAANGYLAELTGHDDATKPIKDMFAALETPKHKRSEEQAATVAKYLHTFKAAGWKEHLDGSWYKPKAPEKPLKSNLADLRFQRRDDRPDLPLGQGPFGKPTRRKTGVEEEAPLVNESSGKSGSQKRAATKAKTKRGAPTTKAAKPRNFTLKDPEAVEALASDERSMLPRDKPPVAKEVLDETAAKRTTKWKPADGNGPGERGQSVSARKPRGRGRKS